MQKQKVAIPEGAKGVHSDIGVTLASIRVVVVGIAGTDIRLGDGAKRQPALKKIMQALTGTNPKGCSYEESHC
jgi:hypothetical protein